jgi:hypothetical protein
LLPLPKLYKLRATLAREISQRTGEPLFFGAAAWRRGLYDNPFEAGT